VRRWANFLSRHFTTGKARKIFTTREPLRCAAAITPFNHPLNQVAHKLAPASRRHTHHSQAVGEDAADRAPIRRVALRRRLARTDAERAARTDE